MKLFLWSALDVGGEYADAWIGVIAKSRERALELVEQDERDWIARYSGECMANEPDVLPLRASEKQERIWIWGS